ncbi:MAG: 2-succinyl-5-enolpyruvyl-6-hydroxy-3-cyclohexene-1-carboxylic-acid synthase [Odoribacter sp.]
MENTTTDKTSVRILTEILIQKGIKHVVLSPGSRNAPLLVAFARESSLEHYIILDERSAAFFALGMAQHSGEPVAIVCTSGTALLNYAPAVAEAYYQRLPLIVISADRPIEWIDQDDSQTIRQTGILAPIVKASYQLPAEPTSDDERWYVNRLTNDAVNCALKGRRGPVHLNVPLREPLYGMKKIGREQARTVEFIDTVETLAPDALEYLAVRFAACRRVMILAGCHLPDERLSTALHRLAAGDNVIILTETPANVSSERHIATIDRVLATLDEREMSDFAPDLLITFGGPLISKNIKKFLRVHRPLEHWSIDRSEHPADTFGGLTTQINLEAGAFFPLIVPHIPIVESDYAALWKNKKRIAEHRHNEFLRQASWSDWKAFSLILPALPAGSALQLANSTPVRYAQLFETRQVVRVDANRGTSGIDGSTSTAVGAARLNNGLTTLITGDMAFLYDSNALWNPYISSRLKIIVIRNGGGGIFRFIPGPSTLDELDTCFETAQQVDVNGFAALHHFLYYCATSADELQELLPVFFAPAERSAILEITTPRFQNSEVLKDYFRHLHSPASNT